MSELVIKLLRVACSRVTDSLAEGATDEFGWRLNATDASGDKSTTREELPMRKMEAVTPGSDHKLNRELAKLGPNWRTAQLEFWEKDTFSSNDLLGRIEIRRDGQGHFTVTAGQTAQDLGGGRFRLTGGGGDYRIWLEFQDD